MLTASAKNFERRAFSFRFSFGRILAITLNTLTELTRQKAFYVLLIFALILIGSSVFVAKCTFQQEFQILKDVSLGAMSIFSSLLAICRNCAASLTRHRRPHNLHYSGEAGAAISISARQTFWRASAPRHQHRRDDRVVRGASLFSRTNRAR